MKFVTFFTTSTTKTEVEDRFTITIKNQCYADVLQQTGASTGAQTAYAGAILKLPAMPWAHTDGITSATCPVTIAAFVSTDGGTTWQASGTTAYTNMITAFSSGALTITPAVATYGAGTSTTSVKVKVTYT